MLDFLSSPAPSYAVAMLILFVGTMCGYTRWAVDKQLAQLPKPFWMGAWPPPPGKILDPGYRYDHLPLPDAGVAIAAAMATDPCCTPIIAARAWQPAGAADDDARPRSARSEMRGGAR